ncbi:MAG TPA: SCO0930 family lipoprotein [Micromonospora sp.]
MRTRTMALLVAGALALTSGCASEPRSSGATAAPSETRSAPGSAEPLAALAFVRNPRLGPVVVDGTGRTLYRFDEDSANPSKSTCTGGCAVAWPPVAAVDAGAVTSLDPKLLGRVRRDDGSEQLTLAGWPLYRYARDNAPGDVDGHGVNGTWFAAAPNGDRAGTADGSPSPGTYRAPAPAALAVTRHPKLGPVLVDGQGRTLYLYDRDTRDPMRSRCLRECVEAWPPVPAVDPRQVRGIDPGLVGTLTRPDGTKQATVNCWPLYRYVNDQRPGDADGHGAGGDFFAVTPKGERAGHH